MKQMKQWIALALTAVMLGTSIPSQTLSVRAAEPDTGTETVQDQEEQKQQEDAGNDSSEKGSETSNDAPAMPGGNADVPENDGTVKEDNTSVSEEAAESANDADESTDQTDGAEETEEAPQKTRGGADAAGSDTGQGNEGTYQVYVEVTNSKINLFKSFTESVEAGHTLSLVGIEEAQIEGLALQRIHINSSQGNDYSAVDTLEELRELEIAEDLSIFLTFSVPGPELEEGEHALYIYGHPDYYVSADVRNLFARSSKVADGGHVSREEVEDVDGYVLDRIYVRGLGSNSDQTFYSDGSPSLDDFFDLEIHEDTEIGLCYVRDVTLKLDANGGLFPNGDSIRTYENVSSDEILSYADLGDAPVREGYSIAGWYTEPVDASVLNEYIFDYEATDEVILYAIWEEYDAALILNPNGGSFINGKTEPKAFYLFQDSDLSFFYSYEDLESYLHPDSEIGGFEGWNTAADGSGTYVTDIMYYHVTEAEMTLYAIYNDDEIVVTFDANGGLFNLNPQDIGIFVNQNYGPEPVYDSYGKAPDNKVAVSETDSYFTEDQWARTYIVNNGEEPDTFSAFLNEVPQVIIRPGFAFAGWAYYSVEDGNWVPADEQDEIAGDTIVYAQWESDGAANVTLHALGLYFGTDENNTELTFTVPKGTVLAGVPYTISNPDNDTYFLGGIYLDEECTRPVIRGLPVNDDLDLYVLYADETTAPRCLVTIYDEYPYGSGTPAVLDCFALPLGSMIGDYAPAVPEKAGYEFMYWLGTNNDTQYIDLSSIIVTRNLDFYAQWKQAPYTLILDPNEGSFPDPEKQQISRQFSSNEISNELQSWLFENIHNIPAREGMVFAGWSFTKGEEDYAYPDDMRWDENGVCTLYAIWIPEDMMSSCTIKLNSGTGYFADGSTSHVVPSIGPADDPYPYPLIDSAYTCPMSENGVFIGWSVTPTGEVEFDDYRYVNFYRNYAVSQDDEEGFYDEPHSVVLYAQYEEVGSAVTFDANGGLLNWLQIGECTIYENAPSAPVAAAFSIVDTNVTERQSGTLFKWVPKVTLAVDSSSNYRFDYLKDYIEFLGTTPQWENHGFLGWYTDQACTIPADPLAPVESCITLYAKWSEESATITLKAVGGCFDYDPSVTEVQFEAAKGQPLPTIPYITKQPNHILHTGLFFDSKGTKPVLADYLVEDDITLYMLFGNYYAVFLDAKEGHFDPSNIPYYDSTIMSISEDGKTLVYRTDEYGISIPSLPVPDSDDAGKIFEAWYLDPDCTEKAMDYDSYYYEEIWGKTLYAGYTEPITITLHLQEGHLNDAPDVHEYQFLIAKGSYLYSRYDIYFNPYAENMDFIGWYSSCDDSQEGAARYSDDDFVNKYIGYQTFDADTELYARFDPYPTIYFDANGMGYFNGDTGKTIYPLTISAENYIGNYLSNLQLTANDPDNYVLDGWYKEPECKNRVDSWWSFHPTDGTTYYAKWKKVCTITFSAVNSTNTTAYFYSNRNTHTIVRRLNEGTELQSYAAAAENVIHSNSDLLVFECWCEDEAGRRPVASFTGLKATESKTYYARYKRIYPITFDANGKGTIDGASSMVIGVPEGDSVANAADEASQALTVNDTTEYAFMGWARTADAAEAIISFNDILSDGDETFYAVYKKIHTINYVADHGEDHGYIHETGQEPVNSKTYYVLDGTPLYEASLIGNSVKIDDPDKVFYCWTDEEGNEILNFASVRAAGNATYYAKYEKALKVPFNANGGSFGGSDTVYGKAKSSTGFLTEIPDDPACENKAFNGSWYLDPECTKPVNLRTFKFTEDDINGGLTLYAGWKEIFDVTFDANGGWFNGNQSQGTVSVEVMGGMTLQGLVPENPSRANDDKIFDGWSLNSDGSGKIAEISKYVPRNSCTLYARWRNNYTVTFDANGGQLYGSNTVKVADGNCLYSGAPSVWSGQEHVNFKGWSIDPEGRNVITNIYYFQPKSNITLYASWVHEYPVRLHLTEGYFQGTGSQSNQTSETYINENDYFSLDSVSSSIYNPEAGKVFSGWYLDPACTQAVEDSTDYSKGRLKVNGAVDLYGSWNTGHTVTLYTVKGHFNDGSLNLATAYINIEDGKTIGSSARSYLLNAVRFDGGDYYLKGWALTDASGEEYKTVEEILAITPDSDMDLYAVEGRYCVVVVKAYGAEIQVKKVEEGAKLGKVTVPASNDERYYFNGFSTDAAGLHIYTKYEAMEIWEDTTLYAVWAEKLTVTLDANGGYFGNFEDDTEEIHYVIPGQMTGISTRDIRREGKIFKGFFTEGENGTKILSLSYYKPDDNVRLYAHWADAQTVTYDANGGYFENTGSATKQMLIEKGTRYRFMERPTPITTRDAVFYGWYYDRECTISIDEIANDRINSDVTVYAKWGPYYTVTLNAEDGRFNDKVTRIKYVRVAYGDTVQLTGANVPASDLQGYVFMGWYNNLNDETAVWGNNNERLTPAADMTLHALYLPVYKVQFDANGGYFDNTPVVTVTVHREQRLYEIYETPMRDGKAFTGWYTDPGGLIPVDFDSAITQDMTLYAGWGEGFTVTFDPGNGEFAPTFRGKAETGTRLMASGMPVGDLAPRVITDEDSYFEGWYLDPAYTQKIGWIDHFVPDGPVTIYAKVVGYVHVTYNANGGYFNNNVDSTENTVKMRQGDSITGTVYNEAREEYYDKGEYVLPDGWFYDQNCTKAVGTDRATEDVTVYLKWVPCPAEIISGPEDATGGAGETAYFSVKAEGKDLSYQWQLARYGTNRWQYATNFEGYDTDTLTADFYPARDGFMFRCIIRDIKNNLAYTQPAVMYFTPVITRQPSSYIGDIGEEAVFTVRATGNHTSYQWQEAPAGEDADSANWTDIPNQTNATCNITITEESLNKQYRCIVKGLDDQAEALISNTVHIEKDFTITKQPQSATAAIGETVYLSVETNKENVTYQWQYARGENASYSNCTLDGAKTSTLTVPITVGKEGFIYRCVVTYDGLMKVISDEAKITVDVKVTNQVKIASGGYKDAAVLTADASGVGITRQWERRLIGTDTWETIEGENAYRLRVTISDESLQYEYRCLLMGSNGTSNYSEPARIYLKPAMTVTYSDETAAFTVTAEGEPVNYLWQKKDAAGNWADVETTQENTYSIELAAAAEGYYRCNVNYADVALASTEAYIEPDFKVESQTMVQYACIEETVEFSVVVSGTVKRYIWQSSTDGKKWITAGEEGKYTDTLIVPTYAPKEGKLFRCEITSAKGSVIYSKPAVLHVKPKITRQPDSIVAASGEAESFTLTASGKGLIYQWQVYNEETDEWEDTNSRTATLKIVADAENNGKRYRCHVSTSYNDSSVYSNEVTLTVE